MSWRSDEFRKWLIANRVVNGSYRHLTLTEVAEQRQAGLAHEDCKALASIAMSLIDEPREQRGVEGHPGRIGHSCILSGAGVSGSWMRWLADH